MYIPMGISPEQLQCIARAGSRGCRAPALENTSETGSSRRGGKGIRVASLRVGRKVPQPCTRVGRTAVGQRPSDANPARWGRRAYCERAGRAREGVGRALKQKKSPREPRGRPGSNRNTVGAVLDWFSLYQKHATPVLVPLEPRRPSQDEKCDSSPLSNRGIVARPT